MSVLSAERPPRPLAPVPWILTSLLVGVLLVFAPWSPWLWESNWLLQLWPGLRGPLLSPFVRGAVTGLGLVNVLVALHDAYTRIFTDRGTDRSCGRRERPHERSERVWFHSTPWSIGPLIHSDALTWMTVWNLVG